MKTETCEGCGQQYGISEWPFCPHGVPQGMLGEYKAHWEENLSPEPVWVTSLAQKQKLLRDGNGTRDFRLEERPPSLTKSQAWDRLMARKERTQREMRERM